MEHGYTSSPLSEFNNDLSTSNSRITEFQDDTQMDRIIFVSKVIVFACLCILLSVSVVKVVSYFLWRRKGPETKEDEKGTGNYDKNISIITIEENNNEWSTSKACPPGNIKKEATELPEFKSKRVVIICPESKNPL